MSSIHSKGVTLCRRLPTILLASLWVAACAQGPGSTPATPPRDVTTIEQRLPTIPYTIQVGAFSTTERAARYAEKLAKSGLDAYYFIDADGLSKVRFGRFDGKEAARRRAMVFQARGLIDVYYIVQPGPAEQGIGSRAALQAGLVDTAHRFIGTPYRWGGTSVRTGFDCSGLTMTVYRLNGMQLPRTAASQFGTGAPVAKAAIQKGDLVFFATGGRGRISHVGIYSGGGKFIHAPGRGKQIRKASLSNSYFSVRYMGARRYF